MAVSGADIEAIGLLRVREADEPARVSDRLPESHVAGPEVIALG